MSTNVLNMQNNGNISNLICLKIITPTYSYKTIMTCYIKENHSISVIVSKLLPITKTDLSCVSYVTFNTDNLQSNLITQTV